MKEILLSLYTIVQQMDSAEDAKNPGGVWHAVLEGRRSAAQRLGVKRTLLCM